MSTRTFLHAVTASLLAALMAAPAAATEGGGTAKILGVETVMAGVMPAPGASRVLMAVGHYRAKATLDGAGQPRRPLSNFDLAFSALTVRLQYVWPQAKLLGADIETRIGYAVYTDASVSFDADTPTGRVHRAGSAQGHGDTLIAPITLGWHSPTYHQIFGLEFFVPSGRFDPNRLTNKSRGYLAIAPAYRFTWFPTPEVEVSGNLVYLYNRVNPDTQIRSGRELSFDYGLGYTLRPGWQLGVSGYAYRQTSDDTLRGVRTAPDGNRGHVMAGGPFLRYFTADGKGVTFKWQIENGAKNKTEGNRFFLQMARNL